MPNGLLYNVITSCRPCQSLSLAFRAEFLSVNITGHLGLSERAFRCSYDHNKCQYFKAFNAIFCKVGRYASEEVVLNPLRRKCLSVLSYGVEACPLLVCNRRCYEFTITRSFMKLFRTGSVTVVTDCQKISFCTSHSPNRHSYSRIPSDIPVQ